VWPYEKKDYKIKVFKLNMLATIAASTGINATLTDGINKPGSYMFSSPAADIGKGPRSDPIKLMPTWTPGPDNYTVR
jgi:hypothetical protein